MKDLKLHIKKFSTSLPNNALILDVGCGTKPYQSFFNKNTTYIGVEAFISGRPEENKNTDIFFNGRNIPLQDNSVDAILCTQVFEHAYNPHTLIKEIHRVMKPGATGLITVPFIWGEHETPFDFRRFTSFGIKKFISENHLEIIDYGKCCTGISAIQTLIFSEINYYNGKSRKHDLLFERIKFKLIDKISHKFILLLMTLLDKFYKFERIYIDNAIIFNKK